MSKKKDAKNRERGRKHKPDVPCKASGSRKPRVDSRSSDDPFWIFVDPLVGDYAMCGNEHDESCVAVFASEALARAEEKQSHFLSHMVAHEASWSEIQGIAEEQCDGRWRIFWAQPAAPIF